MCILNRDIAYNGARLLNAGPFGPKNIIQKIPFSICGLSRMSKIQVTLELQSEEKHAWVGRARYRCSVVTKLHKRDAHATCACLLIQEFGNRWVHLRLFTVHAPV